MEVWLSGLKHSFAKAANRNVPQVRILSPPQKKNEETFGKYKQKLYNKNVKSSLKRLKI